MATSKQMPRPTANPRLERRRARRLTLALIGLAVLPSCSSGAAVDAAVTSTASTTGTASSSTVAPSSAAPPSSTVGPPNTVPNHSGTSAATPDLPERPSWLGTIDLTLPDGSIATGLATPPELLDRRFATVDTLPAPPLDSPFRATIGDLDGAVLEASTWEAGCPVPPEQLRHLTMSFWGFDERPHTGEMIVHADVAGDIVDVFRTLFEARFPIEEMRIITDADLEAPNSGDGNNTSAFVCRAVRGGSSFSEHASGLAIDVNPFLNPYLRGEVLLPELARHYLPRDLDAPGQITDGDLVTEAFAAIGWEWGGNWSSLVDYQHFALNNR